MSGADNPLFSTEFAIPFDQIRPEHVVPGVTALLERTKERVDAIAADDAPPTYENVLGALEDATEQLERAMGIVGHLEAVATSDTLRAAYDEVKPAVSELYSSIPLNEGLWKRISALAASDAGKALEGARARHLDKTVDDFKRHGAELDAEGKKRLAEIDVELTKLTTKYGQNVLDSTNAFELLIALLTYLDDRSIREHVWRAYNASGATGEWNNEPIVRRILALRREKAKLLGYDDFADLVLEDRMAQAGEKAESFVGELRERTLPFFERENRALAAYRLEALGDDAPPIMPWDVGYWAEKQRRELYDFDEEELRPYFAVDSVLRGLFETAERLYGVKIAETDDMPTWHPSVKAFRLSNETGEELGAFYVDLFPREEKRGGAWMQGLSTSVPPEPHLGLFCANVTPAVGDAPALLTHREVETLFHEFGHLLHHMLSRVEVRSLAGTNVAWDFVELPSQIMQNWCWEKEALDLFARHHETGETIPDALFDKMVRARTYRAANAQMRQLGFGSVDLALHVRWDPSEDEPLLPYARQILQAHAPAPLPDDYAMILRFGHLFASAVGYAAGYYSYKWAEVLDADAFTRFKTEGVFDSGVGGEFRDAILSRGDSEDPMALYRAFMGREPELSALFERQGLV